MSGKDKSKSHSAAVVKGTVRFNTNNTTMFATEVFQISLLVLFGFFIGKPLFDYLRDVKGFRKYPNIHPIAGITNLYYMYGVCVLPLTLGG